MQLTLISENKMVSTPRGGVANRVGPEIYRDWIAPRVQVLVLPGNVISTAYQHTAFRTKWSSYCRLVIQCLFLIENFRVTWIWFHSMLSLTHWGKVTHMNVKKLIIIDSDNGLVSGRRQAVIWTNAGILLIGPLAANFTEILIVMYTFSFKKMLLKM